MASKFVRPRAAIEAGLQLLEILDEDQFRRKAADAADHRGQAVFGAANIMRDDNRA
jgi:hypothetical protein